MVPTQFFPTRVSPPLSIPIKRSSSSLHIPQPRHSPPSKSFAQPHASSSQCETQEGSQHSREGSQHSTEGSQHSTDNSQHSHTGRRQSRDSVRSSGSRTVRFDLPSSPEGSGHLRQDLLPGEQLKKGQQSERRAHGQHHKSSPVAIAFRCTLVVDWIALSSQQQDYNHSLHDHDCVFAVRLCTDVLSNGLVIHACFRKDRSTV